MLLRFFLFIALFGVFLSPLSLKAQQIPEEIWVQNQGNQFIQTLAIYDNEERFMRLRTLINDTFDMFAMAKKIIGPRWSNLDQNIQERFVDAFENYLIYVYAANPINFGLIDFNVTNSVSLGNYTRETRVFASLSVEQNQILDNSLNSLVVSFVVKPENGSFLIVDVALNGVSLVLFVKNIFSREMQQNQNNIYVTLHTLEKIAYNASQGNYQNPEIFNEFNIENPN